MTLPSSCVASVQISGLGGNPIGRGATANVWEGTCNGKKVSIERLKAPLNDDKTLKKVRSWCGMSSSLLLKHLWAPQSFFREAVIWKRLTHPNIVPFIGVTINPLQIVSEWMPNGTLAEFVQEKPDVNRISLVSPFL